MDTTEEVARALCSATGKNPDEMQIDRPQRIPQWNSCEAEARKFIAAYKVMAREGSSAQARNDGTDLNLSNHVSKPSINADGRSVPIQNLPSGLPAKCLFARIRPTAALKKITAP
jgi:hypothetical protein